MKTTGLTHNGKMSGGRRSERIAKNTAFSKFKNSVNDPIVIGDFEDEFRKDDVTVDRNVESGDFVDAHVEDDVTTDIKEVSCLKDVAKEKEMVVESRNENVPVRKGTTRKAIREEIEMITKKLKIKTDVEEKSNYEGMMQGARKKSCGKKKNIKKPVSKGMEKESVCKEIKGEKENWDGFHTRSSPRQLYAALASMKSKQKKCI